jgi:Leucine-rich repeat (LRR) protein
MHPRNNSKSKVKRSYICMETLNISSASLITFPEMHRHSYKRVDASWNHIRSLWDEDLPQEIEELILEGNHITSDGFLPAWPNTIRKLNLSNNRITDLNFIMHWPTSLRVLNLSYNNIGNLLNCSLFPRSLEELDISFTEVTHIPEFPPNLKVFLSVSTPLQKLPSKCPDSLIKFSVSHARTLRGIPSNWGNSLEVLELHNVRLRCFPRNLPPTLIHLNLSRNFIDKFCPRENFPRSLELLHIGDNRIMELPKWLSLFPRLRYTIQNNLLVEIPTTPNCLIASPQLIGFKYMDAAQRIQRKWRKYKMTSPFRVWYRVSRLKEELLALAMCPERAGKFEDVSPFWGLVYKEGPINRFLCTSHIH